MSDKAKEFIIKRDRFGNIYSQTEIVRCKDCKWSTYFLGDGYHDEEIPYCRKLGGELGDFRVNPNWFCADGERKL